MILKQVMEMFELLDKPNANGNEVAKYIKARGNENVEINVETVEGEQGSTDFIKILIKGKNGKTKNGTAKTLGIIGRLGGLGARPDMNGFVSDGDGALAALSAALKLVDMNAKGDVLEGDVIVATHICPDAPTLEHYPVYFMDSPVDMDTMNRLEVSQEMDAILAIDTTKGNEVLNYRGFSISPTVKDGYILKISDDLVNIMKKVTGKLPVVFPLSQQDITPYGNDLYHINSILQPSTTTSSPVVGVAITTETSVAGCATGATQAVDVEMAGRFAVEVAKEYGIEKCSFYDEKEFELLLKLYGENKRFQTKGSI
ncbi:DUF1177 domain-containing protein [Sporanaerobacter acetigenes]|uniref:DUF1177 domain-containing protein n=1 Tax=Sporanaerobacter acetigenes DSM 13106 TaxID=1123281 RepID=A0A1M5YCE7_9FIRM|nr:DUF1177 domain-containing protein [Sporanaerobacter acetigenes]SHI09642.1 Protein of unknown function [Sporanaerobacter acetigenes DSM 13106]